MDLVLHRRWFIVGMLICVCVGQWWVCLQQNHGNKQPLTFSITWISSSWLTLTHEWERMKQITPLREHQGGLIPCRSTVMLFVSVFPRCFGTKDDVINVLWWHSFNCFWQGLCVFAGAYAIYLRPAKKYLRIWAKKVAWTSKRSLVGKLLQCYDSLLVGYLHYLCTNAKILSIEGKF
jgi:hypothetical protein